MGAGELVFSGAHSLAAGLAGRGLVGLGDAFVFLNVLRLVQNWFPARRYAALTALTGFVGGIGQLVTTVPLSAALRHFGWGTTFVTSGVVTVTLALVAVTVLRDAPQPRPRRTTNAVPIRRAVVAAAKRRGTREGFLTHFTLMGPFVALAALWGFPYLVQAQHLSRGEASGVLSLMVVVFVVASPAVGGTVARLPHTRDLAARAAATALLLAWVVLLAWPGRPPLALVVGTLAVTAVASATSMLSMDMARADSPPELGGTATGLANCGGFLAAGLAELGIGLLLDLLGEPTTAHWRLALLPVVVLVAIGTALLWHMHLSTLGERDPYPVA